VRVERNHSGRRTMMATDPVCGMSMDEKKAAGTTVHEGKTYYFCSAACKATFEKAPAKYAVK
jgi:Cu+-exporting ATPase